MATSQKTIDQVKNILGKLDRNIDALRERRLGDGPVGGPRPAFAGIGGGGGGSIGQSILPAAQPTGFAAQPDFGSLLIGRSTVPAPAPAPVSTAAADTKPRSPYGRAQRIQPDNSQP